MKLLHGKSHLVSCVFLILMSMLLVVGFLNWDFISDYYRVSSYTPSSEMAEIRDKIELTEEGEFIFNASQPILDNQDAFNGHCRTAASETAVLGCYTNNTIYVYNIESAELAGIREVTAAHELLHAVYTRMDDEEKADLQSNLTQVYRDNMAILQDDLDLYSSTEREEEIYVRVGTEVANLPEVLKKHYAEIFKNQDKIVGYYNNYSSVFKNLKAEIETLSAEMENLSNQIEAKKVNYEFQMKQLSSEIAEFNECATTANCFASEAEFYNKRAGLLAKQENLTTIYNEITDLIDIYNAKVEAYNADVLKNEELNKMINSNQKPSDVSI